MVITDFGKSNAFWTLPKSCLERVLVSLLIREKLDNITAIENYTPISRIFVADGTTKLSEFLLIQHNTSK
jgi:hypothetical protein